ncbi:hypothetical protein COOONC_22882 [Cooperia oncophora]
MRVNRKKIKKSLSTPHAAMRREGSAMVYKWDVIVRPRAKCGGMMTSRMASAVLLIGGCTQREEGGALRSVEELSFQQTANGVDVASRIVGELQEARRSPAVFAENDGFLVIGGLWIPSPQQSDVRGKVFMQEVPNAFDGAGILWRATVPYSRTSSKRKAVLFLSNWKYAFFSPFL